MQILITLLLAVMMMAGLFLLLLGGVGFVQNKSFFSSAPKEVRDAVPDTKPERFKGQHIVGWIIIILAFALMIGAVVIGAVMGIRDGLTFWQLFGRFLIIGVSMKVFDIVFFDYFILTRTRFFQHIFPETEGCKGWKDFGFNRKQQIRQCIMIPVCCLIIALICTFL